MDCAPKLEKQQELLAEILAFVERASGIQSHTVSSDCNRVRQALDGKWIDIQTENLENVISRSDTEGQEFIQVNFCSGKKILITDTLIGFKPAVLRGLDVSKLPKVVTTPDILSVFEALQDALEDNDPSVHELSILKKVFEAVLVGGEAVGFDLSHERSWLTRIPTSPRRVSA